MCYLQACHSVTYQLFFTYFVKSAVKFKVLIIAHIYQICSYLDMFALKGVQFKILSLILSLVSDMPVSDKSVYVPIRNIPWKNSYQRYTMEKLYQKYTMEKLYQRYTMEKLSEIYHGKTLLLF